MRTIAPGQITADAAGFAFVGLVVTVVGLMLASTLISLVNNRIERRVEGIRCGRDPIPPRSGHTVLLGWTDIGSKAGEEFAQIGNRQSPVGMVVLANQISGLGRQHLRVGPVAVRGPVR